MTVPITTMRLDENLKREVKPILENLGLNLTTATNIYLRAIIRSGGIPFDIKLNEKPVDNFVDTYMAPLIQSNATMQRSNISLARVKKVLNYQFCKINRNRKSVNIE